MSESHWRDHATPIIARIIAEHGKEGKELTTALRDAYPFGQRKYHPYKIWLDEIARQLGRKPKLGTVVNGRHGQRIREMEPDPRQEVMF